MGRQQVVLTFPVFHGLKKQAKFPIKLGLLQESHNDSPYVLKFEFASTFRENAEVVVVPVEVFEPFVGKLNPGDLVRGIIRHHESENGRCIYRPISLLCRPKAISKKAA